MKVFAGKGPENTAATLHLALEKATSRRLPLLIATTTGATAVLLAQMARGQGFAEDIVAVTTAYGAQKPGEIQLTPENRALLLGSDVRIVTAAHALSGAERSLSTTFGGAYPVEIIAHTLRMLSQGVKVAVEIAAMAADAGFASPGQPVIAIGGSGHGADTAVRLLPAHAKSLLETRILEIYCKPE